MKGLVRRTVRTPMFAAFVRGVEALGAGRGDLLYVLTYHRIDDPAAAPDLHPALLSATPEEFESQMALVARLCRTVTPAEVLETLSGGSPLPPRTVLITFDDAYEDFARNAWPILRRHGLRATVFVATSFPGDPGKAYWWDRLHRALSTPRARRSIDVAGRRWSLADGASRRMALGAAERHVASLPHDEGLAEVARVERELGSDPAPGRVLAWSELRRLASEGVSLAPHSRTHPLMNRMAIEVAESEAVGSIADLEREVGTVPPLFAYPGGAYTEELPARLAARGIRLAFTTRRGVNDLKTCDRLRMRRINVGRTTSPALLHAQLLPWMTVANRFFPVTGSA